MAIDQIELQLNQCNKCGLCLAACPVYKELLLEKYAPRGKVQLARFYSQGILEITEQFREIFSKCLLCNACSVTCPSGVTLDSIFVSIRQDIGQILGPHPRVRPVVDSLMDEHNISNEDNSERGEWMESIGDLPDHMFKKDSAQVVYFVGCVASFFPMVQSIPQNVVSILQNAEIDFAILGGEEWCCGFPLIGAGAKDKIESMIEHNLERVRALGAKTVIFSCPSCLKTWKEHYHTDAQLMHITEYVNTLIKEGKIRLNHLDIALTYHDPCDLGRNNGVFDAPREILASIPGLSLVELPSNRARSVCCGGGGNVEMVDSGLSRKLAAQKIEEILDTGVKTVVTSCQQCVRTIKGEVRRQKASLDVLDITDIVVRAMIPLAR